MRVFGPLRYRAMTIIATIVLFASLSGCLFVPVAHEHRNHECDLVTKRWTVDVRADGSFYCADEYCAALVLGTAAISGVVSGSIALVGNTLHWLEIQGKCDDGMIKRAADSFVGPLKDEGGVVIENEQQLKELIKEKSAEQGATASIE